MIYLVEFKLLNVSSMQIYNFNMLMMNNVVYYVGSILFYFLLINVGFDFKFIDFFIVSLVIYVF